MSANQTFDEQLLQRLPLPLAQLCRRSQNAKTPLEQHLAAYYLWEASLKLLGATAVVEYAELKDRDPEITEKLTNLARPAIGHWWDFVRHLVPVLADKGDNGFVDVRDLVLGGARDDMPRAAGLFAGLLEAIEGKSGARTTVRLAELFDRLVIYRNREIGHGAAGQRPMDFYRRMAETLSMGFAQILAKLDVVAGRRIVYIGDVRRLANGGWLIERYLLVSETPRRLEPLLLTEKETAFLPRPECVYLEGRRDMRIASPFPTLRSLHPLVHYEPDVGKLFFLNARRGKKQVEYLCYSTGETLVRDIGTDQRELLSNVLNQSIDAAAVEVFAARSLAEETTDGVALQSPVGRAIGEYELLSRLGQGGMGVVYRAWQPSLGRQVALKCMLRVNDPKGEARFAREIRALGRIEHPNVVKVFTSGADGDQWFYAMELIEGAELSRVCEHLTGSSAADIDAARWQNALTEACAEVRTQETQLSKSKSDSSQKLPVATHASPVPASTPHGIPIAGRDHVRQVVDIVRQVSDAVHALHEVGVVHRDIKPGNIMLTADGSHSVLMDLGLAQLADETDGKLTRTRQFVGTLRYASPEQVLAVSQVDRRTDVYSLGVTLWELLTLRPAFGANDNMPTPDLMLKIQSTDLESPRKHNRNIPRDLAAIVMKCVEKDRTRRYATASDLAADLGRYLSGEPVSAQPPSLRYLAGKYARRHRLVIAMAAAILLSALLAAGAAFYQINEARLGAEDALRQTKQAQQERTLALIDALRTADSASVSIILRSLEPVRQDILSQLRELHQQADLPEKQRVRISLMLLPEDPTLVVYLRDSMLKADPQELLVIRHALQPHRGELKEGLWQVLENPDTPKEKRLRAACVLAEYDRESPRWNKVGPDLTAILVGQNPLMLAGWMEALRPARLKFVVPLGAAFRQSEKSEDRYAAANILAEYAADMPDVLVDLIQDADARQFAVLFPKVREHGEHGLGPLLAELDTKLPADIGEKTKETLAKRRANAGAVLLLLGQAAKVWPLLKHSPDPRVRSYLIHRLKPFGANPQVILHRLDQEPDVTIRRALVLSLGTFEPDSLPLAERAVLLPKLLELYRTDPDPGLHGAAEWLLRRWNQQVKLTAIDEQLKQMKEQRLEGIQQELAREKGKAKPQWYVNGQGQTMVVLPPMEFTMGSPPSEPGRDGGTGGTLERQRKKLIARSFAIGAKAVTVEQFRQFRPAFKYLPEFAPSRDCPVHETTWYLAAEYCNWLSQQEGLPETEWCYEPNKGKYQAGMHLAANYLQRTGYRLPTEAEWECACRAQAVTCRHFGESDELLGDYGWYVSNSANRSWPVGSLKPNDWGLFDMHGNVWVWCQERYNKDDEVHSEGTALEDKEDMLNVVDTDARLLRGGSFYNPAAYVRAADRYWYVPTHHFKNVGFRVARTIR